MIDLVIIYILGIKAAGFCIAFWMIHKGFRGFWVELLFKYFLMSFLFFGIIDFVLAEQHLDPSIAALDIIALCWLWRGSRHGVRHGGH